MKKLFFSFIIFFALAVQAQDNTGIKPAAKGVTYGTAISEKGNVTPVNDLQAKMNNGVYEGKITGKVTEVCKAMGCWMKLEKGDGTALMVKTKDHAFFMPQDIVGKTVVLEGTATVKEVLEEKRKHFAEDAGQSKEEIKKIKGSEQQMQFVASGVKVLD